MGFKFRIVVGMLFQIRLLVLYRPTQIDGNRPGIWPHQLGLPIPAPLVRCPWTSSILLKKSLNALGQCFPTCVPRHTSVPRER